MSVIDPRERAKAHAQTQQVDFYAEALKASEEFRKEYEGKTLRENLGLPRPGNRFFDNKAVAAE